MPISKTRPKHALVIRSYAKLEEFAAKFAEGYFNLLILIGDAGIAKSQTVEESSGRSLAMGRGLGLGVWHLSGSLRAPREARRA